jgi:hypothetical protein
LINPKFIKMKSIDKYIVICLSFILLIGSAKAQLPANPDLKQQFQQILYAEKEDASKYANDYMAPVFKGLGYGLNSGWFSTGKAHSTLGFDLSIGTNLAFVPTSDYQFTFRNSDYNSFRLASGTEATCPTILGSNQPGPDLEVHQTINGYPVVQSITAPQGIGLKETIGFSAVPLPVVQLGIGIIKNTDIKVRYAPDFAKDFNYSYWGIGVLHDIKQWIPGLNRIPIDLSIFGSYSSLTTNVPFNQSIFPGTGQSMDAAIKGYTVEALVSKKIAVLTILGSIGYIHATSNFNVLGNYDITYTPPTPIPPQTVTLTDPIAIATKEGGVKLTLGLRFNFGPFVIQGNYSFMGYNVLNTSIGLSIR